MACVDNTVFSKCCALAFNFILFITFGNTGEAMPLITKLGLTQQSNYFGHAAPFHCFTGTYNNYNLAIVTNGKDRKFGCDNVRPNPQL